MRALHFNQTLTLRTNDPQPVPNPDEALIKVRLAGICHTDLELTRGYQNFSGVLGHEFVGEIVQTGGGWQAGQRIVGEINVACGVCDMCARGVPSHCRNRSVLGIANYPGTFADYMRLPFRNLHAVPDTVSDDAAVFTEPLAAALELTAQTPVNPTDRVVLIGAGKLGLLIAQVLKLTGCDLVVVARRDRPIELLKRWGIVTVETAKALPPAQADMVVDVTGNPDGFADGLNLVRPRGTIALKSTYAGLPLANLTKVVVDEIRVVGSRCGPFAAALRLLEAGLIDTESMIERREPLANAVSAFEYAAEPGVLKVILTP